MKWTIISLYLLVFITLLGFGSVIDQVYSTHFSDDDSDTRVYRQLFESTLERINQTLTESPAAAAQIQTYLPDLFLLEKSSDFPLPQELSTQLQQGSLILLDSDSGISLHQKTNLPQWILSFGPIPGTQTKSRTIEYVLTIVFYLGVALVLVLWVRPLLRDVHQLSGAVKKLGQGELDTRLPQNTWYLKELFFDYNRMAKQLQELSLNNQLFSQAVSHDLRTPLARIEFALEKLCQEEMTESQATVIEKIRQDISQVETLATELLDYSRIGQTRELHKESIDLHVFIYQIIAEYSADPLTIAYTRSSQDPLIYAIDVSMFHKLLGNLIGNAVKYASSQVLIGLTETSNEISIKIEDDGEGIDDSLADKIFEPFVKDRNRKEAHFGLGLAICQRVISQHEGNLTADNASSLGGARFTIRLPRQ